MAPQIDHFCKFLISITGSQPGAFHWLLWRHRLHELMDSWLWGRGPVSVMFWGLIHLRYTIINCKTWAIITIKMFAEGWLVYPRPRGSAEPTLNSALRASCQVGSGDPLVLGYTTQPSANILIFKTSAINISFLRYSNLGRSVSLVRPSPDFLSFGFAGVSLCKN